MANICAYSFTPKKGEAFLIEDPNGKNEIGQSLSSTLGWTKGSPDLIIQTLKGLGASGRLEWEEFGLLGLGYYDLEDGEIVAEVTLETPTNREQVLDALKAYPELAAGLDCLLDEYAE